MATSPKHPLTRRGLVACTAALTIGCALGIAGTVPAVATAAGGATPSTAPVCTVRSSAGGCVPATPTGLATTAVSAHGATLTWATVPGATGYSVFAGGSMWKGVAAPPATDASRAPGSTTDYTVVAHDAAGRSAPTAPLDVTSLPQAPTGLVATAGDGQIALSWSAAAGATGYTVLSGSAPAGTTTATSTVLTGLTDGTTYTLSVEATDASGPSAASAAVAATPMPPLPGTPADLTGSAVSASGATLNWNPVPRASSYLVYAKGIAVGATTATTYTDTTAAPGTTVPYSVAAVDASGAGPAASVDVTTLPAAPAGLVASDPTASGATLSWAPVTGATGYIVSSDGTRIGTTAAVDYTDVTAPSGSAVAYTVVAVDASGSGASATPVTVTTLPAAPTGLTVGGVTASGASLTWDPTPGATGYLVYVQNIVIGTATRTAYTDTTAAAGSAVPYSVAAVDASGSGASGPPVTVTTLPAAPTGLVAGGVTASGATLTWNPVTGATGYVVFAQGSPLGSATGATYTDASSPSGGTVTYTVVAVDASGSGASATPVTVTTLPAAPTGLSASGVTASGATLTWNPVTGATGYVVSTPQGPLGTTTTASFTDTSAASGGSVDYQVAAVDASGTGATATTGVVTLPAAPTGLVAGGATASGATLTWNPVTGATGYLVYAQGSPLGSTTGTTYTDASSPSGGTVTYTVVAVDASGSGASATPVTVTTLPAAPTGLSASGVTASGATLTWNPVTGASHYVVSTPQGPLGTTTTASFTDTSAASGSTVDYQVAAVDASGTGATATTGVVTLPAAPTGLVAGGVTASGATLTWNPVTGATGYLVYAQDILVGTATAPTYTDASSPSGSAVAYQVIATDAAGSGQPSTSVTVTTLPAAPTGLSATAVTATGATVTWNPVTGAAGYTVYVNGSALTTTTGTSTTDAVEAPGTTLRYTVTAQDTSGASAPSAPVQVVLAPSAPVGVVAYPAAGALDVRWTAVPGATGYDVTVGGVPPVVVSGTTATVGGLTDGMAYSATVTATDAGGTSAPSAPATGTPAAPTVPTSAFSLLNMEGVVTHSSYGSTPYGNFAQTEQLLGELGVRHVRDTLAYGSFGLQPGQVGYFNALHTEGIGVDLILSPSASTSDLSARVAAVGSSLSSDVDAIEAPNELDGSGQSNWAAQDIAYQKALYPAVRSTPSLGSVPVVGPSLNDALALADGDQDFLALGDLSASLDIGNIHVYPGGRVPTTSMDASMAAEKSVSGSKPIWVTEAGYHDAVNDAPGNYDVTDAEAAVYLPRLLLEWHQRGAGRVNIYELYDEVADPGLTDYHDHFGLVGLDGVPKAQFTALENFNTLLDDTSASFPLTPLTYSVSSGSTPVSSMLLEKSTGQYVLYLWQNVAVSNTATNPPTPVTVPPTPVTVTLGAPVGSITEYRPSVSSSAQASATDTATFTVGLQGDATALVIQP